MRVDAGDIVTTAIYSIAVCILCLVINSHVTWLYLARVKGRVRFRLFVGSLSVVGITMAVNAVVAIVIEAAFRNGRVREFKFASVVTGLVLSLFLGFLLIRLRVLQARKKN